jgi:arylsulfatase A-like enzyme
MDARPGQDWPPLPLMRDETVIEAPVDRNELTQRETEEAIRFITAEKEHPFFLIISHAMPGSTQASFASKAFRGKSRNGLWGDAVEEIDWSAGEIMAALQRLGLEQNTLVVWTSDNPATRRNPPNGSNAPFSGYMGTPTEGGMRIPCIVKWPGHVPAGSTCEELATLMDLMPTFGRLTGAKLPTDRVIDGKDVWPLMAGEAGAISPHEAFFYYHFEQLQAVRSGPWKLFLPLQRRRVQVGKEPERVNSPPRLYNVVTDPAEAIDVAVKEPEVVARLERLAERAREDMGDMGRPGKNQRPAGWVFEPQAPRLPVSR